MSEWHETVRPVVDQLKLSATLNMAIRYEPDGCAALAELLIGMADRLDAEIERQSNPPMSYAGRVWALVKLCLR